jgi:hypothetical protein
MSDQSKPAAVSGKIEIQSSLYEKLTPDLRRRIDRAIADHEPVTYQGLFDKFELAAHGVSFMAFYRYARRIRTNVALAEFAQLSLPDGAPADQFLPEVVGQRFLAAALDDETPATTLYRLAHAYRIANEASYARRRFAAQIENEKRKSLTEETRQLCEMARQYGQMAKQHYDNKARAAQDPDADIEAETTETSVPIESGPSPAIRVQNASEPDPVTRQIVANLRAQTQATIAEIQAEAEAAVKAIEAGEDLPPPAPPLHSSPRNEGQPPLVREATLAPTPAGFPSRVQSTSTLPVDFRFSTFDFSSRSSSPPPPVPLSRAGDGRIIGVGAEPKLRRSLAWTISGTFSDSPRGASCCGWGWRAGRRGRCAARSG